MKYQKNTEIKLRPLLFARKLIFIGLFMTVCISIIGHFYFSAQKQAVRSSKEMDLQAVAKLKVKEISNWDYERQADIKSITQSPFFLTAFGDFLKAGDRSIAEVIVKRMDILKEQYHYQNVFIGDSEGRIVLSTEPELKDFDNETVNIVKETIGGDHSIVQKKLYRCDNHDNMHLDYSMSFSVQNQVFVLVFRVDPNEIFFPMIQLWPSSSESAESLIVRREGENALFLNELRHQKDTSFLKKMSLGNTEMVAVQAIKGYRGICQGIDSHGEKVLADIRDIKGTRWILITKIDVREAFADLVMRNIIIGVLFFILILASVFGLFWYYNKKQSNLYRSLYDKEKELAASKKEYSSLFTQSNDGIALHEMIFNEKGKAIDYRLLQVNPKFEEYSDIRFQDAVNNLASDLYGKPAYIETYSEVVLSGKPHVFETFFAPMNRHFFISVFKTGENKFATAFQDITKRKTLMTELKMASKTAEDASNLKSRILANMSHEIRTPLNGILGFAELLKEELEGHKSKDMASIIYSSGSRLLETLNGIIDLSFAESKVEGTSIVKIDLRKVIRESVNLFEANARKKGLSISTIDYQDPQFAFANEESNSCSPSA